MELIKKSDKKLIFSYFVGTATDTNKNEYEMRATQNFAPIIVFPDGDMVIMNWNDIVDIAKKYKDSEV
jgi:hypothetical protein